MWRMTACLVVLLMGGIAEGQKSKTPDQKKSEQLWREGAAAYDLGQYETAIARFEDAYRLHANDLILYNLGRAHHQRKNHDRAIHFYRTYLRSSPKAYNKEEVEGHIATLEKIIAAEAKSREGPPQGIEPAPPPVVEAEPPPVAPLQAAEGRRWYQDPVGVSLVGGGVVASGVGVALLLRASALSSEAAETLDQEEASSLHDSAGKQQTVGMVCLGVGGALVAGGVLKLVLGARRSSPVGVAVGPRAIAVVGRF